MSDNVISLVQHLKAKIANLIDAHQKETDWYKASLAHLAMERENLRREVASLKGRLKQAVEQLQGMHDGR